MSAGRGDMVGPGVMADPHRLRSPAPEPRRLREPALDLRAVDSLFQALEETVEAMRAELRSGLQDLETKAKKNAADVHAIAGCYDGLAVMVKEEGRKREAAVSAVLETTASMIKSSLQARAGEKADALPLGLIGSRSLKPIRLSLIPSHPDDLASPFAGLQPILEAGVASHNLADAPSQRKQEGSGTLPSSLPSRVSVVRKGCEAAEMLRPEVVELHALDAQAADAPERAPERLEQDERPSETLMFVKIQSLPAPLSPRDLVAGAYVSGEDAGNAGDGNDADSNGSDDIDDVVTYEQYRVRCSVLEGVPLPEGPRQDSVTFNVKEETISFDQYRNGCSIPEGDPGAEVGTSVVAEDPPDAGKSVKGLEGSSVTGLVWSMVEAVLPAAPQATVDAANILEDSNVKAAESVSSMVSPAAPLTTPAPLATSVPLATPTPQATPAPLATLAPLTTQAPSIEPSLEPAAGQSQEPQIQIPAALPADVFGKTMQDFLSASPRASNTVNVRSRSRSPDAAPSQVLVTSMALTLVPEVRTRRNPEGQFQSARLRQSSPPLFTGQPCGASRYCGGMEAGRPLWRGTSVGQLPDSAPAPGAAGASGIRNTGPVGISVLPLQIMPPLLQPPQSPGPMSARSIRGGTTLATTPPVQTSFGWSPNPQSMLSLGSPAPSTRSPMSLSQNVKRQARVPSQSPTPSRR